MDESMEKLTEARRENEDRNHLDQTAPGPGKGFSAADLEPIPGVNPSVTLISPNPDCLRMMRRMMESQRATIAREVPRYPTYANLDSFQDLDCNTVVVDLDSDLDIALDVVEALCIRKPSATVMVYSSSSEGDRMVRAMRAGAREFLTNAVPASVLQEALVRAVARHSQQMRKVSGSTIVFWGAKGGSGVTTLATNFAVALRMETDAEVALIDLNPQLGDVAVLLGLTPRFTVAEALKTPKRMDHDFISTLMTEHATGVSVLAAPDAYDDSVAADNRSVGKLLDVLRTRYPYVVVDAGHDLGGGAESLIQIASTIYLVSQLDVTSLRNTQRLIAHLQSAGARSIELVVNRYEARKAEFDDDRVTKALGLAPKWKIANDYAAAHRSSNTGRPLVLEKSPVASAIRALARAAAGRPAAAPKKKAFSLFGR